MEEWESRQRHGQSLYRQHNYRAALAVFDTLISELHDPSLSILDNRAATYSKLGDLPKAMKDGKRMIHLKKNDPTGYLRTGQVLRLMAKDDTALEIYKYGLKNVDKNAKGAELLRSMRDRLMKQLADPKSIDPLQVLPLELIEMAIGYLNFRTLQRLLLVSKQWRGLITSMPQLWRHVDLSQARRKVPLKSLKEYIIRGKKQTTQVTVHRTDFGGSDMWKFLVARCPRLETLNLISGESNASLLYALPLASKLTTLIMGSQRSISLDAVSQILKGCSSLVRAEFHGVYIANHNHAPQWQGNLSNLRELVLSVEYQGSSRDLRHVLQVESLVPLLKELKELELRGFCDLLLNDATAMACLENLQTLIMSRSGVMSKRPIDERGLELSNISNLPPRLEGLGICALRPEDAFEFQSFSDRFRYIRSLQIDSMAMQSFEILAVLLSSNEGRLKNFSCHEVTDWMTPANLGSPLLDFLQAGALQKVMSVKVDGRFVSDETLSCFAKCCPDLVEADFSRSPYITGVGVKDLVLKEGQKLQALNISDCEKVGHDAIQWAQQKGVSIIRMSAKTAKAGHKVRY